MELLNEIEVSNLLDIPVDRLNVWAKNGKLTPTQLNGVKKYDKNLLSFKFDIAEKIFNSKWDKFIQTKPNRNYTSIELFCRSRWNGFGNGKSRN